MKHRPWLVLICLVCLLVPACATPPPPAPPPTVQDEATAVPTAPRSPAPVSPSPSATSDAAILTVPAQPDGPVTISFGAYEYQRELYAPLIDAFHAQHPNIRVQFVGLDSTVSAEREGLPLGHIVSVADTAAAFVSSAEHDQGYLFDLAPFIAADPSFQRADYYPNAFGVFEHQGRITLLPREMHVPLLSYNRSLWLAHGLPDPTPTWTWADVLHAAETLTKRRGDTVEVYGLVDREFGFPLLLAIELHALGVDLFTTPLEQIRLDQPSLHTALQRLRQNIETGVILIPELVRPDDPNREELTSDDLQQMAIAQQIGIWPTASIGLEHNETPLPFEVATVPAPASPRFTPGASGYLMSAGTQHPAAAWRWLAFVSQQVVDLTTETDRNNGWVPARRSLVEQSGYWSRMNPQTAALLQAVVERPAPHAPLMVDPRLGQALRFSWYPMIRGRISIEAALAESQTRLELLQAEAQQAAATPSPVPVVVAPPLPEQAGTTTIIFDATMLDAAAIERLAQAFTAQHPELTIGVRHVNRAIVDVSSFAPIAQADCFAWPSPPPMVTTTLDLRPLLDADVRFDRTDYPAALRRPFERGAALYGLPHTVDFRVLNYNPALFTDAGLALPAATWSLDDLRQVAQALRSGTGEQARYGYAQLTDRPDDIFFFLDRLGASITRGAGAAWQPDFTNAGVQTAVEYYLELVRRTAPNTQLTGYAVVPEQDAISGLIVQGQVGMWLDVGIRPRFFDPGYRKAAQADFAPAMVPPPRHGATLAAQDVRVQGLYIAAQTRHPQACWDWITYLSGEVASMQSRFPARQSVAAAFMEQAPPGAEVVYAAYRAALQGMTPAPALDPALDPYWFYRAVDRALQGGDLARELDDAQILTEQYLACVRGGAAVGACARQVDPDYRGFTKAE
ncbi:MAG: extracellular solute-binding protein [Chloroflexales bacterium]|nr:extracellular solute-binding protein [Chloroflexales bacterium]